MKHFFIRKSILIVSNRRNWLLSLLFRFIQNENENENGNGNGNSLNEVEVKEKVEVEVEVKIDEG